MSNTNDGKPIEGEAEKEQGSSQNNSTNHLEPAESTKKRKGNAFGYGKRGGGRKSRRTNNDGGGFEKKHHLRRRNDAEQRINQTPHEGSYANPSMREMFGVSLNDLETDAASSPTTQEQPTETNIATSTNATSTTEEEIPVAATPRYPKRKVAMLIAFVGERYVGFQMNAQQRTIQAHIELALYQAGLLSRDNFGFPHKYSWSSSARTDKGVHACAQVCSAKLQTQENISTMDEIRLAINAQLPDDMTCLDVVRTTRTFCAKTQRDCVRYQYMIPSFVFYNRQELRQLFEQQKCHENERHASDPLSQTDKEALRSVLSKFRASPDIVQRLRDSLSMYVGTHCFHNFTKGASSNDKSSERYIMSFDVQDPVVWDDGTEWIATQVTGQSFLLHQIRKMISLAIDVTRGTCADTQTMKEAMDKNRRMRLNVAPAQGLFLDMSMFEFYNRRNKDNDNLDWSTRETPAVERWKNFKETVVLKHIVKEEARDGNFIKYLFNQEYIFDMAKYYKLQDASAEESTSNTGDEKS